MQQDQYRLLGKYGTAGIEFLAAFLVPVGIGIFLDARWGSDPWFTVVLAVVGFAAGLYRLVRIARQAGQEPPPEEGDAAMEVGLLIAAAIYVAISFTTPRPLKELARTQAVVQAQQNPRKK